MPTCRPFSHLSTKMQFTYVSVRWGLMLQIGLTQGIAHIVLTHRNEDNGQEQEKFQGMRLITARFNYSLLDYLGMLEGLAEIAQHYGGKIDEFILLLACLRSGWDFFCSIRSAVNSSGFQLWDFSNFALSSRGSWSVLPNQVSGLEVSLMTAGFPFSTV